MGLTIWANEALVQIYVRYWRVIVFSLSENVGQGVFQTEVDMLNGAEIPKPLSCIFVISEGGHFNFFCTKSKRRGSFPLIEIGSSLAHIMSIHEAAWFDNGWFGRDNGCPMLERDFVEGRLEPLVCSKSITRKMCGDVVQKIVQHANRVHEGLEQYMRKWWLELNRGVDATLQESHQFDSLCNSLRTESLSPRKKIVESDSSLSSVYRNGEDIPTVLYSMDVSAPMFALLTGSFYALDEEYPFLQKQSVAQPRHIQSRIINTDKALSPEGFLDLFYDSSSKSNQTISDLEMDLVSFVMYEVDDVDDSAGKSDPFHCEIAGLCDADNYKLKADFVAKLASPTCFDGAAEALFSRFKSSSKTADDAMRPVVSLGRLFYIIVNEFDGLLSVAGMLRFRLYLLKLFPKEFVAIPKPQCELDLMWQLSVMVQCLTLLRLGIVDGQQRQFSLSLRLSGKTIDPSNPRKEVPIGDVSVESLDVFLPKLRKRRNYQIYAPQLDTNNGEFLPCLTLMDRSSITQHLKDKASPTTLADRCVNFVDKLDLVDLSTHTRILFPSSRVTQACRALIMKEFLVHQHWEMSDKDFRDALGHLICTNFEEVSAVRSARSKKEVHKGDCTSVIFFLRAGQEGLLPLVLQLFMNFVRHEHAAKVLANLLSSRRGQREFEGRVECAAMLSDSKDINDVQDNGDMDSLYRGPLRSNKIEVLCAELRHVYLEPQIMVLKSLCTRKNNMHTNFPASWRSHAAKGIAINVLEAYEMFGYSFNQSIYPELHKNISNVQRFAELKQQYQPMLPEFYTMHILFYVIAIFIEKGVVVPLENNFFQQSRSFALEGHPAPNADDLLFSFGNCTEMNLFKVVKLLLLEALQEEGQVLLAETLVMNIHDLESLLVTQPESSATAAEPGGASSALGGAVEGAAQPKDDSPALGNARS